MYISKHVSIFLGSLSSESLCIDAQDLPCLHYQGKAIDGAPAGVNVGRLALYASDEKPMFDTATFQTVSESSAVAAVTVSCPAQATTPLLTPKSFLPIF